MVAEAHEWLRLMLARLYADGTHSTGNGATGLEASPAERTALAVALEDYVLVAAVEDVLKPEMPVALASGGEALVGGIAAKDPGLEGNEPDDGSNPYAAYRANVVLLVGRPSV
jgi:hypothetical protein